jgi:predicted glycosyltransferase
LAGLPAAADLLLYDGYNTVWRNPFPGVRSLLVPRVTRQEQKLRAELLAERGLVRILLPDKLTPKRLANEIHAALDAPPPKITLKLDGLQRASQNILKFIDIGHPEPSLVSTSTDHGQRHWGQN